MTDPSCQGVPPGENLYGYELTTLAPKNQPRTEPIRYGSLDVRPKPSNIERMELRQGLPQTVANRTLKYAQGTLAKTEMKAHNMLLLLTFFAMVQSTLRPFCQHITVIGQIHSNSQQKGHFLQRGVLFVDNYIYDLIVLLCNLFQEKNPSFFSVQKVKSHLNDNQATDSLDGIIRQISEASAVFFPKASPGIILVVRKYWDLPG